MSSVVIQGDTSGSVTIQAPTVSGTTIINLPTVTGGSFIVGDSGNNVSLSSNLTFTGTASRIIGDMTTSILGSSAPLAFQTSTVNSLTQLYVIPNGTSKSSYLLLSSGTSADENYFQIGLNNAGSQAGITVGKGGTAAYLPLTFSTGGSEAFRVGTGVTGNDKGTVGIGYTTLTGAAANNSLLVSGNVGIGTNAPAYKLDMSVSVGASAIANVARFYADASASAEARIIFGTFANAINGAIGVQSDSATTGILKFYTSTSGVLSEKMRIDGASGTVGIGTASPSSLRVTIEGSGSQLRIRNTTTRYRSDYIVGNSGSTNINSYDDTGATYMPFNIDASVITFSTPSTERMRIDANGNVNIGTFTSSIAKKFTVVGEGNFTEASQNTRLYIGFGTIPGTGGTGSYIYNADNTPLALGTSNVERMRIDALGNVMIGYTSTTSASANSFLVAGNVGIGTNAPGSKLTVAGSVSFASGQFTSDTNGSLFTQGNTLSTNVPNGAVGINSGPSAGRGLYLTNKAGNTAYDSLYVVGIASQTSIIRTLDSAGTTLFKVEGGGNVGIGTDSPVAQLGVYGAGQTTSNILTSSGLGGTLYVRDSGGGGGNGGVVLFGAQQGSFAAIKGFLTDNANNSRGDLVFSSRNANTDTALTERMRILSDGTLLLRGGSIPTISAYDAPFIFRIGGGGLGLGGSYETGGLSPIVFYTQGVEHMRIDAVGNVMIGYTSSTSPTANSFLVAGNVGIGTNAPVGYKLVVVGGATSLSGVLSTGYNVTTGGGVNTANSGTIDTDGAGTLRHYSRGSNASTVGSHSFRLASSDGSIDTLAMQITTGGNVGVGTNNPQAALHVYSGDIMVGNAGNVLSRMFRAVEVGSSGNNSGITFGGNGSKGAIFGQSGQGGLFITGSTAGGGQPLNFGYSANDTSFSANTVSLGAWGTTGFFVGGTTFSTNNGNVDKILNVYGANNVVFGGVSSNTSFGTSLEASRTGRTGATRFAQITLTQDASDNGVQIFYTAPAGSGVSERMRIDSTGYVTNAVNGNGNGRVLGWNYFRLNTAFGGTNATGAQNIFPNNLTLVGSTVYEFEIMAVFNKSAGATSHTFAIGFAGSATLNNINYYVINQVSTAASNQAAFSGQGLYGTVTTAAATTAMTALASASIWNSTLIKGTVSINAGGTFIPQYTLSAAPGGAYSTQIGSYFKIAAVSASGANTAIGNWA
jgi:hypothetical protein